MIYPHRIRLRGPWACEPLARLAVPGGRAGDAPLPPARRVTVPCRWDECGLRDFAGRVRFRRRFGYPGRIDAHERVWLTFAGAEGAAAVWLNGHLLGRREPSEAPFEFEVTSLLRDRNELAVEVEAGGGRGGLWGEVAMEVRCTAFLRGVRAGVAEGNKVRVRGEVVGASERPLDLYVLLDGRTAGYTTVTPSPHGEPFQVDAEAPGVGAAVRVELVDGGTVWYVAELTPDQP
jgi:hypothetical protein